MFNYLVSVDHCLDFSRKNCPLRMLKDQVGFEYWQIWEDVLEERHILEINDFKPHQAVQKIFRRYIQCVWVWRPIDALDHFQVCSYPGKNEIGKARGRDCARSWDWVRVRKCRETGGYEKGLVRGLAQIGHLQVRLVPVPHHFDVGGLGTVNTLRHKQITWVRYRSQNTSNAFMVKTST